MQGHFRKIESRRAEIFLACEIGKKDLDYVLRHELGHAFDQTYLDGESISSLPGFERAFQKDSLRLTAEERKVLKRYCVNNTAGREETFASLYAHAMGTTTDIDREVLLKEKFPKTYNWVEGLVEAFKNERT